jgi:threonine dehydratase
MVEILNIEGIVLEPAGALAIDALQDLSDVIRGRRVLCVVSGGNFDFERLPEVKERSQKFLELKKYFILRMPQRPGALRDFLDLLGDNDDVARFEYFKKSARNFGSVLIGIETDNPKNFQRLFERMSDAGLVYKDITNDQTLSEFVL